MPLQSFYAVSVISWSLLFPLLATAQSNTGVAAVPQANSDATVNDRVFWESVKDSRNPAEYRAYLGQFPNGIFASLARARLAALGDKSDAPQVQSMPLTSSQGDRGGTSNDLLRMAPRTVFRDCADCPEMVVIPPGTFLMGTPEESGNSSLPMAAEWPVHSVTIARPFAVGKFEVTRGQFARFISESGYDAAKQCMDDASKNWRNPGFPQTDNHPVVCIAWNDAKAYATWLARKTGKAYRLLSEAEWEYSVRAGSTTLRPWGDDPTQACRYENVGDIALTRVPGYEIFKGKLHECDDGQAFTAPVGSYLANAFGLYDMIGNVPEWTEDCFSRTYEGAPSDGSAWRSGNCARHIVRGGDSSKFPMLARSGTRRPANNEWSSSGLRVARAP